MTLHKKFRFWSFTGAAIGSAIALAFNNQVLWQVVSSNAIATTIFAGIHAPASLLADGWVKAGLPPHGDAALVYVPTICIVLQWIILGVIAGLASVMREHRTTDSDHVE